jgi:hypothetical protein
MFLVEGRFMMCPYLLAMRETMTERRLATKESAEPLPA